MKITFWGTRGSIPTPGPKTMKYGGNTPCIEIEIDKTLIILDAGTGIRELGIHYEEKYKDTSIAVHIFITHTHWDHIQGLPFFTPMFKRKNHIHIYGSSGFDKNLQKLLSQQMDMNYFPVALDDVEADIQFHDLSGNSVEIDVAMVDYIYMNHLDFVVSLIWS